MRGSAGPPGELFRVHRLGRGESFQTRGACGRLAGYFRGGFLFVLERSQANGQYGYGHAKRVILFLDSETAVQHQGGAVEIRPAEKYW